MNDRRPAGRAGHPRHPDRADLPVARLLGIVAASAWALGLAGLSASDRTRLPESAGGVLGVAVAVLAVLCLPSVSIRVTARAVVLVSGALLLRFGVLAGAGGGTESLRVVAWLVAALSVLVLTDRTAADQPPALADADARPGGWATARTVGIVALALLLFALLVAPAAQEHFAQGIDAGRPPSLAQGESSTLPLRSSDQIDMSTRPRLSDRVVMTVEADRPTFWRGEVYDQWDGQRWTATDPRSFRLGPGGSVTPGPSDVGAAGSDVLRQRFRIEADYADIVYAAASAVTVRAPQPVIQRLDGTLRTFDQALGRDATYTVVSRRVPASPAILRRARGAVPAEVASLAEPAQTTPRVRRLATRITQGAATAYDKVEAIERWMGRNLEYSLDAPLTPAGRDVVDDFLFRSKEGWCEQVASSLVVLLRQNRVPARLVTGFAPGDRDPVSGAFVVREQDAHAWAEVWFPTVGWVPFDPTASVPFAGQEPKAPTIANWITDHLVLLLLAVVAVVAVVVGGRWAVRRLRARPVKPRGWPGEPAEQLERLARRLGRPRRADETLTALGAALAERLGAPDLAEAGRTLDDEVYAPGGVPEERRAAVEAALARHARAEDPGDPVREEAVAGRR